MSYVVLAGVACAHSSPALQISVEVPDTYSASGTDTPTGESEAARHRAAYEAFWWNCVSVRATDAAARCPFSCSGTAAATDGCGSGASAAERGIHDLARRFPSSRVQSYLQSLSATPEAREKMKRYFPDGPRTEAR